MNPATLYAQLEAVSLPHIQAYHEDLTRIDRNWLADNPGVPFLHFTRECGTYLCGLHPHDHPKWPADGTVVKYIFATADRWHILKETAGIPGWVRTQQPGARAHHFDGHTLRPVTLDQAVEIATDWRTVTESAWRKTRRVRHWGAAPATLTPQSAWAAY